MIDEITIVWVAGALVGAAAFAIAKRRITSMSRAGKILVPLCFCLAGLVPAALLQCNLVEKTTESAVASAIYFIAFSVVATVALNGIVARSEVRSND